MREINWETSGTVRLIDGVRLIRCPLNTGFTVREKQFLAGENSRYFTRNLGSESYWLNQISRTARPIRSTTQIWVVTRHQYGISALVSQTSCSIRGETVGGVAKSRLFSQVKKFRISERPCYDVFLI